MSSQSYDKMPLAELKKILKRKRKKNKEDFSKLREKLLEDIKREDKISDKISKKVAKVNKPKPKPKPKKKRLDYEEYFEECIRNKKIPEDAPLYLKQALRRAIKERDQGLIREKSAIRGFVNLYKVKGEPGLTPFQFFSKHKQLLKDFFYYHRNIKFTLVLVCMMEYKSGDFKMMVKQQDKTYFRSETYTNLKSTEERKVVTDAIRDILNKLSFYQLHGSGWYFKEVLYLEIHTYEFNPIKGSSYIPLPDWITRKKAITSIRNNI